MKHGDDLGCNSFTYMVKGEGVVTLVKLGVRDSGTINHGLVITEDVTSRPNLDAKIA
jgi:hypothetical protein